MFSIALAAVAAAAAVPMTIPGPSGPIAGTFLDAGKGAPVVLMIPGSGPTNRDGNNPMGVTAAPYRMLAEALAANSISSLRADKRGMFGSKAAIPDANKVTIGDYVTDARNWVAALRKQTGASCVWLLGHSEGGLVALSAAQNPADICGVILVATPGRKLGVVMREQLRANPANAPILQPALAALDKLEAGRTVDPATLPAPLQPLFGAQVQGFLIDVLAIDPPALAAKVSLPLLIVQGGKDLQVSTADARELHQAQPKSILVEPVAMNHVMKDVLGDDRATNLEAYSNPSLPVDRELVESVAAFVKAKN